MSATKDMSLFTEAVKISTSVWTILVMTLRDVQMLKVFVALSNDYNFMISVLLSTDHVNLMIYQIFADENQDILPTNYIIIANYITATNYGIN